MSRFFISILYTFIFAISNGQIAKDTVAVAIDSVKTIPKTPLKFRLGFDVGKFAFAQLNDSQSIDFTLDINYKKYFVILEFGNEVKNIENSQLKFDVKGSYFRLGIDYDLYDNWKGMDNNITLGLRYGYAYFDTNLYGYTINQPNHAWQPQYDTVNKPYDNLSANWLEIVSKVQVETFRNLYLGYSISFKYLLSYTNPDNFSTIYIPGFFNKNSYSNIGFGMQYIISYQFNF